MNIKTLQYKNTLTDEDGDSYLNLIPSSYKEDVITTAKSIYIVTSQTEMRMDLISIKFYGSPNYIDILCEANNIYNPFSIKAGDVLVIPHASDDGNLYEKPSVIDEISDQRSQYINKKNMTTEDANRVEKLKEKAKGLNGGVKEPLPPNMLQPGINSKTYKDGKIILGSNLNT